MNRKKMLVLADAVEISQHFAMSKWCGSTQCISGTQNILDGWLPIERAGDPTRYSIVRDGVISSSCKEAMKSLELTGQEAHKLFSWSDWPMQWKCRCYNIEGLSRAVVAAEYIRWFASGEAGEAKQL